MQLAANTVPFAGKATPKQERTEFSVLLDRVRALQPVIRDDARGTRGEQIPLLQQFQAEMQFSV